MKSEIYLHPNTSNKDFLLTKLFSYAHERYAISDASETTTSRFHGFGEIVEYILSEVKKLHNLTISVSEDEKYELIWYLEYSQGAITYSFLDEVYQVYNEALKKEIVETSVLPHVASFLYDVEAFIARAVAGFRESYS